MACGSLTRMQRPRSPTAICPAPHYLAIANAHAALAQLFTNTHWAGKSGALGVWVQALRRVPGALIPRKPIWMSGMALRHARDPAAPESGRGGMTALSRRSPPRSGGNPSDADHLPARGPGRGGMESVQQEPDDHGHRPSGHGEEGRQHHSKLDD